jgi:glutamate synthase (NADPH/NADH) small chain
MEAERCLECGGPHVEAPCVVACPAHVDVPSFVAAIARGECAAAAATIFAENLLGGTCARVCPVEVMCQGACVLDREGRRPIEIARLQRHATEWALGRGMIPRVRRSATGRRVAVLGAGPAGLVCGGELAALGHWVTIWDAREEIGGLARYAIAPYRQWRDPLPGEGSMIAALGVEFRLGVTVDNPTTLARIEEGADAVFLAVGLGADADVRYPGDDLRGVWESLPFIEAIKTGSAPEVGDRVAVIGGGNTAVDVAREARRLGAHDVVLLYRRTADEMPAYRHEVAEAEAEGVRFRWLTNPVRFLGDGRLEGVECQRMRLGAPDHRGRPRPEPVPGTEYIIPADAAVKALGQRPRIELLGMIDGLEVVAGRPTVDPRTGQTTNPRYFAGGDALSGGATVVEAVRDAKIAARGIHAYLCGLA